MEKNKSSIYYVSKSEINRRIVAYTTLIVSFLISIVIFAFNYITAYPAISLCVLTALFIILFGTRMITVKYFKSIINNKITLTPEYIIRNENKYLIKDIKQIYIKRTTGKYIREITITLKNEKTIINGVDKFEEFTEELHKYLPKDCIEKNYKEPLDYDHPAFYFFFGILVGLIGVKTTEFFINLNSHQLLIFYYILSIFTILFGLYFIVTKPIYKRDEKKNQITDYIWGLFFITAGISVILFYII